MKVYRVSLRIIVVVIVLGVILMPSSALTLPSDAKPAGTAPKQVLAADEMQPRVYLPLVRSDAAPSPFGVQTYWALNANGGLEAIQAMNARWVRRPLSWVSVEPTDTSPNNFNWSFWDAEVAAAASSDLSLIATLQGNPSWAAQYPGGPLYPEHMVDFLELMQAATERYDGDGYMDAPGSPVAQYWEFYNEPDNGSIFLAEAGYGYWGDYGAEYADLYRQVARRIEDADMYFNGPITPKAQNISCPDCGSMVHRAEGCMVCSNTECGWTRC